MRRFISRIMIITLTLGSLLMAVSCKKNDNNYVTPIQMHSVTFFVQNEQYQKKYVKHGERVKEITGQNIEGKNFLYWSLDSQVYNFYSGVNENLKLYSVYEDAEVVELNGDSSKLELTKISYDASNHLLNSPITNLDYRYYIGIKNTTDTPVKIKIELTPIINFSGDIRVRLLEEEDSSALWYSQTEITPLVIDNLSSDVKYIIIDWMIAELTPEIIPEKYEVKMKVAINIVNE